MKTPPFYPGPAKATKYDSRATDEKYCSTIKKVWAEAGYIICAEVIHTADHGDGKKNPIFGIRSNLVNGLPSGRPILARP